MSEEFIDCVVKSLPEEQLLEAANLAADYNPANKPAAAFLQIGLMLMRSGAGMNDDEEFDPSVEDGVSTPAHLAVLTTKYWGSAGVKLTVGFPFDSTPNEVKNRILAYANEWGKYANMKFVLTGTDPQIRISRAADGYWSYLGTDILMIPKNQPTMNLQGFTMQTSDAECMRVIPHEFGHTAGFPHEHMRPELIARLDPEKTIEYFRRQYGWSAAMTRQQVLTPLSEASIRGTPNADQDSIMCYQLPGSITRDGQPIRGGAKLDSFDQEFANKLYPLPIQPPPPPPPANVARLEVMLAERKVIAHDSKPWTIETV